MRTKSRSAVRALSGLIAMWVVFARLSAAADLPREVRLTGDPNPAVHYYRATTEVVEIAPDGRRKAKDVYDLWVEYTPRPGAAGDLVTCRRFEIAAGGKARVALPALDDWSYPLRYGADGLDERGFIFGIDQTRFEQLADASGETLPLGITYSVFNAFVDFHAFDQVFARRSSEGGGIQNLQRFGQTVLHAAANKAAPISLGSMVSKGSRFQNGAITLELKGLSRVGARRCALIGYDSGESSLEMTLTPAPQVTIEVKGGSRYAGDLHVDLETQWLLKATLMETVVTETTGALLPQKVASVIERRLLLRALSKSEFDAGRGAKRRSQR